MLTVRITKQFPIKVVLVVLLLEIFLGGGGRLFDIGTLSIRMYLFCLSLMIGGVYLWFRPFNRNFFLILIISTFLLVFSSIVGVFNNAPIILVLSDVKPLLSIYYLIFLFYSIRNVDDVFLVVRIVIFSSLILAIAYIMVIILLNAKLIPFQAFYNRLALTGEFFFRGEISFFYKGFIYLCIGFFFVLLSPIVKYRKLCITILASAIILTLTRGFILTVTFTYFFYLIFIAKKGGKLVIALMLVSIVFVVGGQYYLEQRDIQSLSQSDSDRIIQLKEVMEAVTPISFFFGHGFGIGVPSRLENMEIAYAEIFHKQGIVGLFYWILIFVLVWLLYKRTSYSSHRTLAIPFILSVIVVFVQSFTNPFVNNPIGLTMVLVSLVSLNVLSDSQPSHTRKY